MFFFATRVVKDTWSDLVVLVTTHKPLVRVQRSMNSQLKTNRLVKLQVQMAGVTLTSTWARLSLLARQL